MSVKKNSIDLHRPLGYGVVELMFVLALIATILVSSMLFVQGILFRDKLGQTKNTAHQVMQALTYFYQAQCQNLTTSGSASSQLIPIKSLKLYGLRAYLPAPFSDSTIPYAAYIKSYTVPSPLGGTGEVNIWYLEVTADVSLLPQPLSTQTLYAYQGILGASSATNSGSAVTMIWDFYPYGDTVPAYSANLDLMQAYTRKFAYFQQPTRLDGSPFAGLAPFNPSCTARQESLP